MADTPVTQITDAMMAGVNGAALRAAFDQFYAEFKSLLELRDREIRRLRNDLTILEAKVDSAHGVAQPENQVADRDRAVQNPSGPADPASRPPDA